MASTRRTLVLNVVGLTADLLPHAPVLSRLAAGRMRPLIPPLPAVTCTVQASMLTGRTPAGHGCVANGWYDRDLSEILFWKQSNRLVAGETLWEEAKRRDPSFIGAKLFWWYNMYSGADVSVTPRPIYTADGRKLPDIYTRPAGLRDELARALGPFPLFRFWGPAADLTSSRWIADCAAEVERRLRPSLSLVYLPHLDYDLQRFGPDDPRIPAQVAAVDALAAPLIETAEREGTRIIVLSEYGITRVNGPIAINRALREAGLIAVREEQGGELLDPAASDAFAVADHQIAHVHVARPERTDEVRALVAGLDGVERVLDRDDQRAAGIDHPRSGTLVAVSRADRWFSYPYWLDEDRAPDFARTVEIFRKPGYDPAELFLDPAIRWPRLAIGWRLARKALGFRTLMDVIPLDAGLVRGSHGRPTDRLEAGPLLISSEPDLLPAGPIPAEAVKALLLAHLFG
ncbi:alkaline phosphatase family protein [Azospirillum picis]|uniref:AlkP superfamily pyrophosphatase or phosphodiesterase n=1 Tax=Azospirillum picis TaxID=488438 RepID=A0ABU0MMS6_9PROT|nr:nucleotide pyrophosphatase/phosphodiesterase family protein [Azospirillum picis]MBP2300805.1 putative AlkP superfamily pyrophosphatase or phosphodiesterase [Azospirillum picis]MDQ0534774.1 putative AlkP superfamily pyrophosphatase or phosphodiesterase [Azospirillum picis]